MKTLILICFFGFQQPVGTFPNVVNLPNLLGCHYSIDVNRNANYKGRDLELLYTITCKDHKSGQIRNFEVLKTNKKLKSQVMGEFILSEVTRNKRNFYPFHLNTNNISADDIKNNCILILKEEVKAAFIDT